MLHEFRDLMSELKRKDIRFDRPFERHNEFDDKIKDTEEDRAFLGNAEASTLEKEKLHVRDKSAQYLASCKK